MAGHRRERVADAVKSNLSVDIEPSPDPAVIDQAAEALTEIARVIQDNDSAEQSGRVLLEDALESVEQAIKRASGDVAHAFASFRDNVYGPKVNALSPEDREVLSKQIQVLEETKRLPLVEVECNDLLQEVKKLANTLHKLCHSVCEHRDSIARKREEWVTTLNQELPTVKLRFLRAANHTARAQFQNRYGTEGATLINYVSGFGQLDAYQNLRAVFKKLAELELELDRWDVQEVLYDVRWAEFLQVHDEDDMELSLLVGKAGFVPVQSLSGGQRCVAVFPLLLRNSRGPLVIDQPEDNLDNRYIADTIAPDFLLRKREQQFIVTSHNANLVVLTDADFIMHIDSDGATATCAASGFLSCSASVVKKSVLDVLDGGEAALTARYRKYGVRS